MASLLHRLGRFAFRRRRTVAAVWVLALVLIGLAAGTISRPYSTEFSIPGTESQQALDVLSERFPQAGLEQATANIVFAAPAGQRLDAAASRAAIGAAVAQAGEDQHVTAVSDPFATQGVSPDGRVARSTVTYDLDALDVKPANRDALFGSAAPARAVGLEVEFSGIAATEQQEAAGATELLGVVVAAGVLLVTFGSIVAAGLPLLTALIGVGVGMAGITALTAFVELSSTAPVLALMLGLAVGIDYALFILSRYRHELLSGRDGEEAAGRAVATAGSAVIFAGLTVIIALVGLFTVNIPFLTVMGLGAAGTVVVAVLVALTLLPALLGFAGKRVVGKRGRAALDTEGHVAEGRPPLGQRWAQFVVRHKGPVVAVTIVLLGLVAIPAMSLRTALPDEGALPSDTTQRRAYDLLPEGFGAGSNGPLVVVVESDDPTTATQAVTRVSQRLKVVPGVVAVAPAVPNRAGDTFLVSVVPQTGPSDPETEQVVNRIRDQAPEIEAATDTRVSVTGTTALTVDVTEKLASALPIYLFVVIGLALLLLVVFRSILVPLKAAAGFLLTVLATFGAVVAVFQWGWLSGLFGVNQTGPILAILPIFMIGIIFGLAMDYEVFLVTRIREEYVHGASPSDAVVTGFRHGARVVSAAALIMVSVFAAFMLSPDATSKSLGFAFGIAVDAFVVRMTLVPAVLALLGDRAWRLPRWLDRVVPRIDVEGEQLGRSTRTGEPERVPESQSVR